MTLRLKLIDHDTVGDVSSFLSDLSLLYNRLHFVHTQTSEQPFDRWLSGMIDPRRYVSRDDALSLISLSRGSPDINIILQGVEFTELATYWWTVLIPLFWYVPSRALNMIESYFRMRQAQHEAMRAETEARNVRNSLERGNADYRDSGLERIRHQIGADEQDIIMYMRAVESAEAATIALSGRMMQMPPSEAEARINTALELIDRPRRRLAKFRMVELELIRPLAQGERSHKMAELRGAVKGIRFTEEDIAEAKRSLFGGQA